MQQSATWMYGCRSTIHSQQELSSAYFSFFCFSAFIILLHYFVSSFLNIAYSTLCGPLILKLPSARSYLFCFFFLNGEMRPITGQECDFLNSEPDRPSMICKWPHDKQMGSGEGFFLINLYLTTMVFKFLCMIYEECIIWTRKYKSTK